MMTNGSGASIEDRLARLETAEEVRSLASEYAVASDTQDLDRMLSLFFAPDMAVVVGDRSWWGHDEVREFFRAAWEANPNPSRHFMTNIAMSRLERDAAEATSCFLYVTVVDGRSLGGWGWYVDECVRDGGRLVFRSKRIHMDLLADLATGWAEQFTKSAAVPVPVAGPTR